MIDILIEDVFKNRSPSDATEYLNDLANDIISQGRFTGHELKRCLEEHNLDLGICPKCAAPIKVKIYKQWSEAWGAIVHEDFPQHYCEECGWRESL
jgi:hypothetical protein